MPLISWRHSLAAKVRAHRARLRGRGLRPIQIWVPDTQRPGFAQECRRQSRLVRDDVHEALVLGWLEQVADTSGWE